MILHNRINREELKKAMRESQETRITISFYQYAHIGNPGVFRDHLFVHLVPLGVLGRIYVAKEGINAQISVAHEQFDKLVDFLETISFLRGIRLNEAVEDDGKSFFKLKVKVRNKIVADGLNDQTFDVTKRGKHLSAEEFNTLADDPETIIVDMRNHYESEIGHFEKAIIPDVDTFREALPLVEKMLEKDKDKNIVMYCTGGIRCEKASAYYKHKGFKNVFQLEGGIIKYAKDIQEKGLPNKFIGKNFVFDERLGERISEDIIANCHQCGKPWDRHTNCGNEACNLLFIQCDDCAKKHGGCCSERCHEISLLPIEEQKALRKGKDPGIRIFSKGRFAKGKKGSLIPNKLILANKIEQA